MDMVLNVQVEVPGLQARYGHGAAVFSNAPYPTSIIVLFGGIDINWKLMANTTVLEFGESTCSKAMWYCIPCCCTV